MSDPFGPFSTKRKISIDPCFGQALLRLPIKVSDAAAVDFQSPFDPNPRQDSWHTQHGALRIDVLKCDACGGTMKILAIVPASDAKEALEQALPQLSDVQPQATSPPSATELNQSNSPG